MAKDATYDGDFGDDLDDDSDSSEGNLSDEDKTQKSTDKRVSDLQSKADKETARANKAEAQLKRLLAVAKEPDAEDSTEAPLGTPTADGYVLEMARMFTVQANPRLAEYGLSEADLSGSTPGEIAQSAAQLIARFEKVETRVRNKVLAENGLAPEIDGAPSSKPVTRDFSKMSSEDFKKFVDSVGHP